MHNNENENHNVFVEVIIDVPVNRLFTYRVPPHLRNRVQPGERVYVPFRGRPRTGLINAVSQSHMLDDETQIKEILDLLDPVPVISAPMLELLSFVGRYYFAPPGEVMRMMLPKPLRTPGKKWISVAEGVNDVCLSDLSEKEQDWVEGLLSWLEGQGGKGTESALRKAVKGVTHRRVGTLVESGFITVSWEPPDVHQGKRMVPFLELVLLPPENRGMGIKQRRVLEILEGRGAISRSEVMGQSEASSATIRSLIKQGWIVEKQREHYRDPFQYTAPAPRSQFTLTEEQEHAVTEIVGDGRFDGFRSFLLHGITGSGKTAVYIEAIRSVIKVGKRILVLLPEIALTPQFVSVFRSHFRDSVAVLHSGLSDGERFDQWRQIKRGEVDIVIGTRSAVFAPIENLGLIVVDEEHDGSFKQESGVRYHARDVALVRANNAGAVVVLGSATPSLDSIQQARLGRSSCLRLTYRPTGQDLPEVSVIDMRENRNSSEGLSALLSQEMITALEKVVSNGHQGILFLNRRGHSTTVLCQGCSYTCNCPHCEIPLTYHMKPQVLTCHYCDYREVPPELCPVCGDTSWVYLGAGTEKLMDQIARELQGFRLLRLDRDTAGGRNLNRILDTFRAGQADILIGTQMVTKGHDFPNVTLVGVVMADLALRIPDFRSGERTFQLLSQVAGRAGRGVVAGRVLIQTYLPEHPVIIAASGHDFESFSENELRIRKQLGYPPFGYLIALRFEGADLNAVKRCAHRFGTVSANALNAAFRNEGEIKVLGPVEAPLARLKGIHRWQMLLRGRKRSALRQFTGHVLAHAGYNTTRGGVHVVIDVDPYSMV